MDRVQTKGGDGVCLGLLLYAVGQRPDGGNELKVLKDWSEVPTSAEKVT